MIYKPILPQDRSVTELRTFNSVTHTHVQLCYTDCSAPSQKNGNGTSVAPGHTAELAAREVHTASMAQRQASVRFTPTVNELLAYIVRSRNVVRVASCAMPGRQHGATSVPPPHLASHTRWVAEKSDKYKNVLLDRQPREMFLFRQVCAGVPKDYSIARSHKSVMGVITKEKCSL